jgi:hypothetical protein
MSDIFSLFLLAKLFGAISPKTRRRKVMIHVANHTAVLASIPAFTAKVVAITVAKAAVNVFTKLFPIRIAIRSLSLLSLMYWRSLAQYLPSLMSASILCGAKLISASSVQEKKPERINNPMKMMICRGSTCI